MNYEAPECRVQSGELKIKASMTGVQGADTHGHVNYVHSRSVNMLHCHIGIGSAKNVSGPLPAHTTTAHPK